jgi:hypothetical protein
MAYYVESQFLKPTFLLRIHELTSAFYFSPSPQEP